MMESSSIGSTADLLDGRMGFGESVQDSASNFIRRFIERVCSEAGVTEQHLRNLTENIPSKLITKMIKVCPNIIGSGNKSDLIGL